MTIGIVTHVSLKRSRSEARPGIESNATRRPIQLIARSVSLASDYIGGSSLPVGVDNTTRWGAARKTEAGTYVAFTKIVELNSDETRSPMPMSFNIGLGDGRFQRPGSSGVGVFGSLSVSPWRRVSVVADWDGRDANAGLSIVPFARMPVVLTIGAINIGQRYNKSTEFAGGIGYLFTF